MPPSELPQAEAARALLGRAHAAFVEATHRLHASPPDVPGATAPLEAAYRDAFAAVAVWHRLPPEPEPDFRALDRWAANFASGLRTPMYRLAALVLLGVLAWAPAEPLRTP
jgi:hypothetical protein